MKSLEFIMNGAITTVTMNVTNQIIDLLKSKFVYSVDITRISQVYDHRVFTDIFKNIPITPEEERPYRSFYDITSSRSAMYDITVYHGCKIFLVVYNEIHQRNIYLFTLKSEKCKDALDRFIIMLGKRARKISSFDDRIYAVFHHERPEYFLGKQKRTFDDVFITDEIYSDLNKTLSDFIANKKWYKDHNIPYHFGILLYGPPGTGKSTLIAAISNKFKVVPFYVQARNLGNLCGYKEDISKVLMATDDIKLFVVEDVDSCEFLTRSRWDAYNRKWKVPDKKQSDKSTAIVIDDEDEELTLEESDRNKSLSSFLNVMDGNACFENVIWVFTTNYKDRLDPSLIRSGRIDRKFMIDYADIETFNKFMLHHFWKSLPDNLKVRPNVSFADVQTDVMSGLSYEQIVNKYLLVDLNKI